MLSHFYLPQLHAAWCTIFVVHTHTVDFFMRIRMMNGEFSDLKDCIMIHIYFFLVTLVISLSITGADKLCMTPLQQQHDAFVKLLMLAEPGTEQNYTAWKDGLSTRTIAALHCVNKQFNKTCKIIVDAPRKALIKKYAEDFTILNNCILFNKYGQWCAIATNINKCELLIGDNDNLTRMQQVNNTLNTLASGSVEIRSFDLPYYDEYGKESCASVFWLPPNYNFNGASSTVVLTDTRELYSISLSLIIINNHASETDFIKLHNLQYTFPLMVNRAFGQSQNAQFWKYRYDGDGISLSRINKNIDIFVDPLNPFFQDSLKNHATLRSKWFENDICSCSTNHIDQRCFKKYENLCSILDAEGLHDMKPKLIESFARFNILHSMKHISIDDASIGLYINPFGEFILKPVSLIIVTSEDAATAMPASFASYGAQAARNAQQCYNVGNFTISHGTIKYNPKPCISYRKTEDLKNNLPSWHDSFLYTEPYRSYTHFAVPHHNYHVQTIDEYKIDPRDFGLPERVSVELFVLDDLQNTEDGVLKLILNNINDHDCIVTRGDIHSLKNAIDRSLSEQRLGNHLFIAATKKEIAELRQYTCEIIATPKNRPPVS